MSLVSYKCPNCGGGLQFDPKTQKFTCEYCSSEFTEEDMKKMEAAQNKEETASPAEEESGKEGQEAVVYTCPSCGAEIVTDDTTAATFWYYCHKPIVLSGRLSGKYLPDYVIPFAMDKKEATEKFLDWIKKKKYVPNDFFSKEQIEKFSGIYFPYLLYNCNVDGAIRAETEKNRSWTTGNIRYTEHKQYQVERQGCLEVKNLTRNALSTSNKELVEGVLPFDMNKTQPFRMGYLSGFQAEKRDMESNSFTAEAEQEVQEYALQSLKDSISGYDNVRLLASDTKIRDAGWKYALLPVWILTYQDKVRNQVYYFAMNGQSGKIWGRLPIDKKKLMLLFAKISLPIFAVLMIGGWFL